MISFTAQELHADGSYRRSTYAFEGSGRSGFTILREGSVHLELPPGYEILEVLACGICSTDQARRYLPFPLPQITGHEILAKDRKGRLVAAEINASHAAAGVPEASECGFCGRGLANHCPERFVLGIDRLPGGFGPYVLVPERNVVPVPEGLPPDTAVLVEPFAAALHAVETLGETGALDRADTAAVLGAGRLGLLVTAALDAYRAGSGAGYRIAVAEPNPKRAGLAKRLGADKILAEPSPSAEPPEIAGSAGHFDVVVEATGSPAGLERALRLARREVHVKSTTGRETLGLRHLTEMVVDEIDLAPFSAVELERCAKGRDGARPAVTILGDGVTAEIEEACRRAGCDTARLAAEDISPGFDAGAPDQADVVVVASLADADLALRPWPGCERGLVRPRGAILIASNVSAGGPSGALLESLRAKNIRISTSRCGDFRRAFPHLQKLERRGVRLGELLVTHRMSADDLDAAFRTALLPGAVKVVVDHASA